jgi:hypothetical protein
MIMNKPDIQFTRFFSVDSPKAIKAYKYGCINAINYMAPDDTGSTKDKHFTLCPHSSAGCRSLCLGMYSGQAAIVSDLENGTNKTRDSRKRKAQYFINERKAFMNEMTWHIQNLARKSRVAKMSLVVRPNGSTDIPFEKLRHNGKTLPERFGSVQFVDYTKSINRVLDPKRAKNYDLTFSLNEENEDDAKRALKAGYNVAVVFGHGQPKKYLGHDVIDGTIHDLRHLDPSPVIVGLDPKGSKAKNDKSGFVVRNYKS